MVLEDVSAVWWISGKAIVRANNYFMVETLIDGSYCNQWRRKRAPQYFVQGERNIFGPIPPLKGAGPAGVFGLQTVRLVRKLWLYNI
jgi:hypothetical protein